MVKEDKAGTKPMFRDRNWKREERDNMKMSRRLNWYKGSEKNETEYKSVLFVTVTKGGEISQRIKEKRRRTKQEQ